MLAPTVDCSVVIWLPRVTASARQACDSVWIAAVLPPTVAASGDLPGKRPVFVRSRFRFRDDQTAHRRVIAFDGSFQRGYLDQQSPPSAVDLADDSAVISPRSVVSCVETVVSRAVICPGKRPVRAGSCRRLRLDRSRHRTDVRFRFGLKCGYRLRERGILIASCRRFRNYRRRVSRDGRRQRRPLPGLRLTIPLPPWRKFPFLPWQAGFSSRS